LYPTCKTNSTNYFAFLRFRTTQQQTSVSLVTPASARVSFVIFLLGYSSHLSLTSSNYFCFHQATPATRLLARRVGLDHLQSFACIRLTYPLCLFHRIQQLQ